MKDLKGIRGKFYIASLIEEGEHEHQDFKFAISDARKIARSISAFANNGGGRLLVGVKDNGVIAGVRNEEDIYVIEQAAEMYCRPSQEIRVTAFRTEGDKTVLRIEIDRSPVRPVVVLDDGPVAVEDFMLSAHVSRASAEDTVIRLHSMGILDFHYNGKTFLLTRRNDPESEE